MILSDLSIKRPVVACVINLLIIVFGILAINNLPLREYPDVSAPVVSVAADYDGASADIMESQVAKIIEDQLSGIRGVISIDSRSFDGKTRISIEFENTRDIEAATNDVRDAVSRAKKNLPDNMDDPTVSKNDSDDDGVIGYTVSSDQMSPVDLGDYINRQLLDPLSLIDGVSSIELRGYNELALLVKLDPVAMASRNVTIEDIQHALLTENLEAPAGSLTDPARIYTLRLERSYQTVADYQTLMIRKNGDGSILYLSDIAKVEIGSENEDQTFRSNNRSMVMLEFLKQSDANTLDVVEAIKAEVERLKPFLPDGMEMNPLFDSSIFITSAIREVYSTLGITSLLVVLVIYIFLGSARATLIPAVSVPVSLIGTFALLMLFGYSINLITLLALVLSVGLLVDDSIVVLENIHSRIEKGEPPIVAAYRGAREVGMAVIATTLVLMAVFLPITLLTGTAGMLFKEYAVTLAASVGLSSIVALTMGPLLGSRVLKLNAQEGSFANLVEKQFTRLESVYRRILRFTLKQNWIALVMVLLSIGFMSYAYKKLPQSFVPNEDQGRLFVRLTASEGISFHALVPLIDDVEQRMKPLTNPDGPIQTMGIRAPARNPNEIMLIIELKNWNDRSVTVFDVSNQIRQLLQPVAELKVTPMVPSSFSTRTRQPVQVVIGGSTYETVQKWIELLKNKASENPGLRELESDYNETTPRMNVTINQAYAHKLGIPVSDISSALETVLAGQNITTFVQNGEEYDVNVRAPERDFNAISDLARIHLRTDSGSLVRLDTLIDVVIEGQPQRLNHYNRRKSITLSADLTEGYSLGEALAYIEQLVINELPDEATIDYKGDSLEYKRASSSLTVTFILALVVVYLVLAAQFESFIHPMVIMMTVPLALTGAMGGMLLTGLSLDIYTQISLVMLIGIATKNGILIVEFINQLRDRSVSFEEAIIQGSVARLRPILMTAITTLAGSVPLIIASGAGHESRSAIGVVIFSGVLVATFMTLFVAPGLYRLVAVKTGSPKDMEYKLKAALKSNPDHYH